MRRVLHALVAAVCAAAGLALSSRHPLGGLAAALIVAAGAIAMRRFPQAWLFVVPASLPVLGLAPWSGWQGVEEIDLVILAAAAGGYAALAARPVPRREPLTALAGFMLLLFAASTLFAMTRGIDDAGGWHFGWYQGLREPLGSVRLAKPFFEGVLMLPLWRAARARSPDRADDGLSAGLLAGLIAACLAALWERLAFTGMLDFSTDYRTTALFWEMHVGGAAFDGFLALTVPFALAEALAARRHRIRWILGAVALVLAGYACLTTFSRGVYLGIPLGLAVTALLHSRQRAEIDRAAGDRKLPSRGGWAALLLVAAFLAGASWIFPSSGYRGVLALLGCVAVLLRLGPRLARLSAAEWLVGFVAGIVLTGFAAGGAWLLPKGAYVVFAVLVLLTLTLLEAPGGPAAARGPQVTLALGGFVGVVSAAILVALHWGGEPALQRALPVMFAVLAMAPLSRLASARISRARPPPTAAAVPTIRRDRTPWPSGLQWQGGVLAAMVVAASGVGALAGGSYMPDRFSTSRSDLDGRRQHWRDAIALLREPTDWAFGIGLNRFPARYALMARPNERPGDYGLVEDREGSHLVLVSGTHLNGWGELFRVSQRVSPPDGSATLRFSVRTSEDVLLQMEVCEKHLLYNANCLVRQVLIPARPDAWQDVRTVLEGTPPTRGASYAPRLIAFSIAVESRGHRADIDNLALVDGSGRELLVNGDFSQGLSHWFATSDRHHLPWHAKNMALHELVEQGVAGLALLLVLVAGALWRLTAGSAARHPLAPAIAGALAGFAVVGLTDSLLNVPRIAFLFYLLLLLGLTLTGRRRASQ